MLTPKGQIQRAGSVNFGDARISIWEEGIPREWKAQKAWERLFKRQVFARIVQTLNRIGWTCTMPEIDPHSVKHYGGDVARWSAESKRMCQKGELKGFLEVSGRSISFEMWQGVNTPTRPDHGGRYESNKEGCMPYLLRLEMERTRRRIRDYLCNVFSAYEFEEKKRSIYKTPLQFTAMEHIQMHYAESSHFKEDMADYLKCCGDAPLPLYNCKSADGQRLEHGQRVWTTDYRGRWVEGTAFYNINNMWWVLLGKYNYTNKACFDLHTAPPPNPRQKCERLRRRRLEAQMAKATKAMDFKRAELLKSILWPTQEPLYFIKKGDAYFEPDYNGYTTDKVLAGKYTAEELKPYANDIERGHLKAIPLAAA